MKAEIISTGDEVITGMIDDTNATWLCSELLTYGIQVSRRSTCSDDVNEIANLISERSKNADVLFINGGLGPTSDDNTSKGAAIAAGVKLVRHTEWIARIKKWHQERGREMPETNLKQADLPQGASVIDNRTGTACGIYMVINGCHCFLTPGVPSEFKIMINEQILPLLKKHFPNISKTSVKRFFLCGVSEAYLQQKMNFIPKKAGISFGYRTAYPLLEIKVISHGSESEVFQQAINVTRDICMDYIVCEDCFSPAQIISEKSEGRSFLIKDTVTGGDLAYRLSDAVKISLALSGDLTQKESQLNSEADIEVIYTKLNTEGSAELYLVNRTDGTNVSIKIKINPTIKEKIADAFTLLGEMVIIRWLSHEKLPVPQIASIDII